ncbi:MAG TPA: HepT-like ribonuclease domain-containing protein [Mycobacterium sp.]|nr:HepT-like ribonuclease domain-containing protein [Mycobacterium sp.]
MKSRRPDVATWCQVHLRHVHRGVYRCRPVHLFSAGLGSPADNGDAMKVLGAHGVFTAETSDAMRKAVGFRNVLVHEYVEVSDEIVVSRLSDPGDLEQFVEQVTAFLHGS